MKRTILSKPDSLGRVIYMDQYYSSDKPYCGVCGKDPRRECEHIGILAYGQCAQIFFTKIEES